MNVPVPHDEPGRLAAIDEYRLAGIGREEEFDRLTELASTIFQVPIALVSIVGAEAQCFRGACGLDALQTPREVAFCAFAIMEEEVMVVEDALKDHRFRNNPLVSGDPFIRFYAGAPLRVARGHALGTLCLIDTKPRSFGEEERKLLETFARTAVDLLELRVGNLAYEEQHAKLKDAVEQLRAVLESAKDGILTIRPDGRIDDLNEAAARMLGYDQQELIGKEVGSFLDGEEGTTASLEALQLLAARKMGRVQEMDIRRRDGSTIPAEVALSPMKLSGGTFLVAVVRDISRRKEVERLKNEFVSTVSHELRTPLTSIAGSLGLVSGGAAGQIPPAAERLIKIAHSNSERLVRLINDILDIEKIESGKMPLQQKPIPLRQFLENAVQANLAFAEQYDVRLELVGAPSGGCLLGDEDRLMQVVTNLLSNAVKFSPSGGTVGIEAVPRGEMYRISVSDEGPGIPEDFRDRIFGKFAQANASATREKGGTGLGLSIVREIVTRHGGQVSYETETGVGTRFHVDLPAAEAGAAVEHGNTARPGQEERSPRPQGSSRPCILHVEDDPDVSKVLASAFDGRADMVCARDLQAARKAMEKQDFDLVILDLALPGGWGLELLPDA
ncbi:MAG TPA: ATP-binding protein, partial [Allosphingosinicella sp.]|nr:ATP-binding protein [Allosphingosinicella sp.]